MIHSSVSILPCSIMWCIDNTLRRTSVLVNGYQNNHKYIHVITSRIFFRRRDISCMIKKTNIISVALLLHSISKNLWSVSIFYMIVTFFYGALAQKRTQIKICLKISTNLILQKTNVIFPTTKAKTKYFLKYILSM